MFPRPRSIIKFPDSARNRNPEEYKGTVFYRTFVLLAPFYNSGTRCSRIWPVLVEQMESSASAPWAWKVWNLETIWNNIALYYIILHLICSKGSSPFFSVANIINLQLGHWIDRTANTLGLGIRQRSLKMEVFILSEGRMCQLALGIQHVAGENHSFLQMSGISCCMDMGCPAIPHWSHC